MIDNISLLNDLFDNLIQFFQVDELTFPKIDTACNMFQIIKCYDEANVVLCSNIHINIVSFVVICKLGMCVCFMV